MNTVTRQFTYTHIKLLQHLFVSRGAVAKLNIDIHIIVAHEVNNSPEKMTKPGGNWAVKNG